MAVRKRLARKIIKISALASVTSPRMPTSSANPVSGKRVDTGVMVNKFSACCVNNAATVAVRGSSAAIPAAGVLVAASTGVMLGVAVTGMGVRVFVGVAVHACATAVNPLAIATCVFCELISAN